MIAEFNSYMSNIDIDFFKELCLKHGELRHYKKNEFISMKVMPVLSSGLSYQA